ncbi:MAG: ATP-binding protein [Acidimicrobiia bacterium]
MGSLVFPRTLRVQRHRATTAHLCSAYPFLAEAGLGPRGVYLGTNVLTGGGGFAFDPFEAYAAGTLTNPNMLFAGEVGVGKSATAKTFIYRSVGVFGRWVAIADPKGEYLPLAQALGLDVISLRPGGTARINPLDPGPAGLDDGPAELARRQAAMVGALVESVLHRDLTPVEDAVLGWAVEHLGRTGRADVTLVDVAAAMSNPTTEMARRAHTDAISLARSVEAAIYGLGKLLDRSLRGMFDGPTTVHVDWAGPGIVVDLSAVQHDPEALTLVMIATTAWLQAVLARPDGPPRLQVLDEAWTLLGSERTTRYLQSCWKLSRAYGVANLAIVHRLSDLRAQADDGTATSKLSMGLLSDTQTRVLFRQSSDQVHDAAGLLELTGPEAQLLPKLTKGRALWKVGDRTAVVAHVIGAAERRFCDTDARMTVR